MTETVYHNLYEITDLQQKIMRYIDYWVHVEKTPIPQRIIILEMKPKNNLDAVKNALTGLIRLGYIRRAITNSEGESGIGANKTKYVMLRRL